MYSQFLATNTKFFLGKLNKEYCIFTRTKTGVLYMFYFRCHEIYIRTGNVDPHCFLSIYLVQIFQDRLLIRTLKDALTFAKNVVFPFDVKCSSNSHKEPTLLG